MKIKRRTLPEPLPQLGQISPLLQRLYAARGITQEQELDITFNALLPFETLTDIQKACLRLEKALQLGQRLLIVGDFDADGATSTALAVSALRSMGATHVDFLVPNRFEFGYGLTPDIVHLAKQSEPHLIITVDNGISSHEGVDTANALGIDVLVTDHHLPGDGLPNAVAIVNPNQDHDLFSSKCIAGVGVIFYLLLALRRHLTDSGWFTQQNIPIPNMANYLDLVALGTVADVVTLDQNNRILVNQGLKRIRQGACRPGIKALAQVSKRQLANLKESDLGFAIAPRLNAAGRLDDMSLGINCLLCTDDNEALEYAQRLDELNQERRVIEGEMNLQALEAVQELSNKMAKATLPEALCLMDPLWHQGVIGILAGRLKERFHRPVIAFAKINDTELKGSARSVQGVHIKDVLANMNKNHPGLIGKFGGHAMAAGLSIPVKNLSKFQSVFVTEVAKWLHIKDCEGSIWTDGSLAPEDFNLSTANLLEAAGPWGQQFPEPCFDDYFIVLDQRLVGKNHLKLTLAHEKGGDCIDGIAFNIDTKLWPNHRVKKIHAAYKLDINTYQNRSKVQLLVDVLEAID